MQERFDALIIAGYDPNRADPLAQLTGAPRKALVEIGGRPMIWHVVQALRESGLAREMVIVGMGPEYGIDFGCPIHFVPNQQSLWDNEKAGMDTLMRLDTRNRYVLVLAADTPLLTGEMIRWFVDACQPLDKQLYAGIVREEVMVATFPESRRSYLALQEGRFCSGDLFLGDLHAAYRIQDVLREVMAHRKNTFRQVRILGLRVLLKVLFRRLAMADLLAIIESFLQLTGAPVVLPYAEIGMDIDKPHQLEQVFAYLEQHPQHPIHGRPRSTPPQAVAARG